MPRPLLPEPEPDTQGTLTRHGSFTGPHNAGRLPLPFTAFS
ncbi:hypothetical protein BCEN4_120009 [Burkholderia cenocepacia]|nr:hypothetical protein BCEN4_120009 [Burkholderia cenocepacia]